MYKSSILWCIPADAVFCESSEERTTEDKQIRAKKTFEEMMKYLPGQVSQHFEEMIVSHFRDIHIDSFEHCPDPATDTMK